MEQIYQELKWRLKQDGHSLTAARKTVFAKLYRHEPQTMHELVHVCAGSVNRASVYRIVALFEELDIAHRLPSGWKYKIELSSQFSDHHHHLVCLSCGKIAELPENIVIEKMLQGLAAEQGFQLTRHQLELQGYCSNCLLKS